MDVLEGRGVGSSGLVDLVHATELAKGAALLIADESVCKVGVVPAFLFEVKEEVFYVAQQSILLHLIR